MKKDLGMAIDFDDIDDFARGAVEAIAQFKIEFILSSDQLLDENYTLPGLNWMSVPYGEDDVNTVPDDRRGIYAFAVCKESPVLPPHCYVLYIGIAGRKSDRSLRSRYKDYLNVKKVLKRDRIARMVGTWRTVLRFYYAPVDEHVTSEQLEELEKELNGTLLPPLSEGDLEAGIKRQRRAFK